MPHFALNPEFWVLVAAVVFVAVAWKPMRRAIVTSLDARAQRIRAELDEAQTLREEAERLLADYQKRQRDAVAEAEAIVVHAKAEAERIAAQAARDLAQSLERRRLLAEERIAQAEAKAVAEIRAVAVDVAIAASREVIVGSLDERGRTALIDAAIASLPRGLN